MRRLCIVGILMACLLIATNGFGAQIAGVTIESVNSEFLANGWDLAAVHTVDGSGLTGVTHDQQDSNHMNSWQTITQTGQGNIVFDIGGIYTMEKLHVWNLNFYSPYNGRGAKDVVIYTSFNNIDWSSQGRFEFSMATGQNGDPGFDILASGWGDARYVQFDILSNWGGYDNAGHVGLSEVQFFSGEGQNNPVPEPATMILFGLGLLGVAGVSRKRN